MLYIPLEWWKFKQTTDNTKCRRGCEATGILIFIPDGNAKKKLQPLWEIMFFKVSYRDKYTCLSYDPIISLLREMKAQAHTSFYSSFICNCPKLESIQMLLNRSAVVHPYNGILRSNQKELTTDVPNNLDESQGHYGGRSQTQMATNWVVPFTRHFRKGKIIGAENK